MSTQVLPKRRQANDTAPLRSRHQAMEPHPGESWLVRSSMYACLTGVVLLIHGYHPFAEDGGVYASGVEYLLHPAAFPHYTGFVTEHLRFSLFAPLLATLIRCTHLSVESGLFVGYLVSTALMFAGADRVLQQAVSDKGRFGGLLLLALWWTLPVAGTSLFLQDPYLTARTVSAFLFLFAISVTIEPKPPDAPRHGATRAFACIGCLVLATALHPLMSGYAVGFLLYLLAVRSRFPWRGCVALSAAALLLAGVVQQLASPETPAAVSADLTRYYWFLASWRWYERAGLIGPLLVLWALERWAGTTLSQGGRQLCRACLVYGGVSVAVALFFAQPGYASHAVARLQPLRAFVVVYAAMVLLLGSAVASWWSRRWTQHRLHTYAMALGVTVLLATGMFWIERLSFPHSDHLELPHRFERSPNAWVQAFLWIHQHAPEDALFAMDAHYITLAGEDAQSFRAIAHRSALPDYSKDGGEAAITPNLASAWQQAVDAQIGLDSLSDAQRDGRLRRLGADWMILRADTPTRHDCPYRNAVLKVCQLTK